MPHHLNGSNHNTVCWMLPHYIHTNTQLHS